ncbi:hypothetical protein ACFYT4_00855 [Streptomyces sp. NPDC004609]|uniref:hypothetical protein n=1 Tax=Streptomyces sp. NPDC004609 TaxID=3364704 RepID=UPI0036994C4C
MTTPSTPLPPVAAEVAAGALDLLPARLRKRVDGALAKVPGWPVEATPDGARIGVDGETAVTLKVTGGIVARADDAVCDCLLAPACLHRAAVLSSAPLAEEAPGTPDTESHGPPGAGGTGEPAPESPAGPGPATGPAGTGAVTGAAAEAGASAGADITGAGEADRIPSRPGSSRIAVPEPAPGTEPDPKTEPALTPTRARAPGTGSSRAPEPSPPPGGGTVLTPAQVTAVATLRTAATAVLVTGVTGAGAVHRAELLHAAHSGRLAGLHLPAAAAVRIARRLGEARSEDPAFRLSELSAELAELLDLLRSPADAVTPARRSYEPSKPLRLYGLFTEPVVTASGYAGATAYGCASDGTLYTVSDVAPGGPARALQAAGAPVPGGCALPLRAWGDGGGVILTHPTLSPDARVGGGSRVRSVKTAGARWHEPPLDALWRRLPADQLSDALDWLARSPETRTAGGDLLFLTGTVTSAGFRVTDGPLVLLLAPDERPELPYEENLRLLSSRTGLRLRLIGRVTADRPGAVQALAAAWEGHDGEPVRMDLGLRRLNRSHIPGPPPAAAGAPVPRDLPASPPALPMELDLLRRTVDRAVAGGRAVVAASADGELPRRLRAVGLTTGARCARSLAETASDRRHDGLGRLLPADPDAFATAWLAAAVYTSAAARSLLPAAWSAPPASPDALSPK